MNESMNLECQEGHKQFHSFKPFQKIIEFSSSFLSFQPEYFLNNHLCQSLE